MAEHRPFPPSPRRLTLARATGLHAASPLVVSAVACGVLLIAVLALGRVASARLGAAIAAACTGAADPDATLRATRTASSLGATILDLALPMLVAAALAAVIAHLAQTRAVWLPRRRLPHAPQLEQRRVVRAGLDLVFAAVIGAVAFGWVWMMAPRLAALSSVPGAGARMIASFGAALAITWIVLGTLDALVRHGELARSLRMSHADKREDDRLAGADPRWRARRAAIARTADRRSSLGRHGAPRSTAAPREAIAGSSVLVLGDDIAVAIAWDPVHRPIPVRTALGRAAIATQLLGLARVHAVPVQRDPALAHSLAEAANAVPEALWPRLAEIIAATRGRRA